MDKTDTVYAIAMDEYVGDASSLSCYNLSDYMPLRKCLGLISVNNGYVSLDDVGFRDIAELAEAYPDLAIANAKQFSRKPHKAVGERQFWLLGFSSDDRFENGGVNAEADGGDEMFCVLELYDNWAEVLDWGYSSPRQLLAAWNTESFLNVGKGRQYNQEETE